MPPVAREVNPGIQLHQLPRGIALHVSLL